MTDEARTAEAATPSGSVQRIRIRIRIGGCIYICVCTCMSNLRLYLLENKV